ncbi:MAG TPA: FkbM family methyltransferase [Gemmataceae bacterium]|nr:FkbM family methyltransferase [Gemmataceae bacterium]
MLDNVAEKLSSPKWLREAIGGRVRVLISSIGFTPTVIEREVAGENCLFYLGNVTGKCWYGTKSDVSHDMTFVKHNLVKPGDVVIECGGHHGAQTVLLSRWVGDDGKVIVVEPIPENVAILKKNVALNELKNVIVVSKAASDRSGRVTMRPASNGSVAYDRRANNALEVESVSLDDLAAELGVKPTFIKIDVEGFEYRVLRGAANILAMTPAIFVEVHTLSLPRYGDAFEDLWSLINPELYEISLQREDYEQPIPYTDRSSPGARAHLFFKPKCVGPSQH